MANPIYKNPLEQSKELLKNDPWTPEKEKWSDAYYREVKDAIQEDEKNGPFKKGEKVIFANPLNKDHADWQDEYEILGFYNQGNLVDENTADPYDKTYGVRVRNTKTGNEYPVAASYLKRR